MELPFDPEYFLYNNRMSPESLNNVTPDEQYWAVRQKVIFRNTGEFPVEISGPDAIEFANYIFTRDISKINEGRCSYQFACYHDGGAYKEYLFRDAFHCVFDIGRNYLQSVKWEIEKDY